jgi:hypothetical protein
MTKDERTVYVFALRYALPRQTYALGLVAGEIMSKIHDFETWEVEQMIRECQQGYPGHWIDQQEAAMFISQLETELAKRKGESFSQEIKRELRGGRA